MSNKAIPNSEDANTIAFVAASSYATSPAGFQDRFRMALGEAIGYTTAQTLAKSIDDLYYAHVVVGGGAIDGNQFGPPAATTLANYTFGPKQIINATQLTGAAFDSTGSRVIYCNLPGSVYQEPTPSAYRFINPDPGSAKGTLTGSNTREVEYNADGTKVLELDFTALTLKEWTLGAGAYDWSGTETNTATKSLSGVVPTPLTMHIYNNGLNALMSSTNGKIYTGTFGTAYDVTTFTADAGNTPPRGITFGIYGMQWNTDGTILACLTIGGAFVYVDWYDAATPYDVSTLTLNEGRDIAGEFKYGNGQGPFAASPDLQKILVLGSDTTVNEATVIELLAVPDSYPAAPTYTNVVLNLDMEGTHLSQVTTDNSNSAHTVAWAGGAASYISNAQAKFGTTSAYINHVGRDHIAIAHSTDFELGSGDFTIEFYMKSGEGSVQRALVNLNDGGTNDHSWTVWEDFNGAIYFYVYPSAGTATPITTCMWAKAGVNSGNWHHIALTRSGDQMRLFIDGSGILGGVNTGLPVSHVMATAPGAKLRIGDYDSDAGTAFTKEGYFDDVRITKGQALYTTAFIENTATWPTA